MNKELTNIVSHFEIQLRETNSEREKLGTPGLGFCEIKLLGQFSLLASKEQIPTGIHLRATEDLDAILSGDQRTGLLFRKSVKECGLEFDDLSREIWIPEGASFNTVKEHSLFRLSALDPISALISKAVKAPEKNKILIREALQVYGPEFRQRLEKYEIDLDFFLSKPLELER